jgi:hypothetical protein
MNKALIVIALAIIVLTVVPQAHAQTAQQQKELEQIAQRSMNGLSPKDRKRVVEIMTDAFVAQGIPRQQAIAIAEQNADSMFSADVGEISAEERQMFEEQQRAIGDYEQRQKQPQQQQVTQPGDNAGWPSAALFREYGHGKLAALKQPAGTTASYSTDGGLVIYLTGGNANAVIQDLARQIETAFKIKAQISDGEHFLSYNPDRERNGPYALIRQERGTVRISFGHNAA